MPKKTKPPTTAIEAPKDAERFTAEMTPAQAKKYPLLSIHKFNDDKYGVVAIMNAGDKVNIEFLRLQS